MRELESVSNYYGISGSLNIPLARHLHDTSLSAVAFSLSPSLSFFLSFFLPFDLSCFSFFYYFEINDDEYLNYKRATAQSDKAQF